MNTEYEIESGTISIDGNDVQMSLKIKEDDGPTDPPIDPPDQPPGLKKWNPGHYVKTQGNPSDRKQDEYWEGIHDIIVRKTADIPELKGAYVAVAAGVINPRKGVYDWTRLDETLEILKEQDQRMIIDLTWKVFSNRDATFLTPTDSPSPAFRTERGWIWPLWRPADMDRMIEIFAAIAEHYDDNDDVELVTGAESAPSFGGVNRDDYNAEDYFNQLVRLNTENAEAFKRTIWCPNLNSLSGFMEELVQDCYQKRIGFASPDYKKLLANEIYDGRSPGQRTGGYIGTLAHHDIISGSSLKDHRPPSVIVGGLTEHGNTHVSWVTTSSAPSDWASIKAAIQANPDTLLTAYPSRYVDTG